MSAFNPKLPTLIFTDAEPDDVAALGWLLPTLTSKVFVVVTEHSNLEEKAMVLEWALCELFLVDSLPQEIRLGCGSRSMVDVYAVPPRFCQVNSVPPSVTVSDIANFVEAEGGSCNVFSLCPPRDLLLTVVAHPTVFSESSLYVYGSYNNRLLLSTGVTTKDRLLALYSSFQDVVLYETHFVLGANNAFCREDFDKLDCQCRYVDGLQDIVLAWNQSILTECAKCLDTAVMNRIEDSSIMDVEVTDPLFRDYKVWWSVKSNLQHNLLLADIGLVMFVVDPQSVPQLVLQPVTVDFSPPNYYTTVTKAENSLIKLVAIGENRSAADVRRRMVQKFLEGPLIE